MPTDAIDQKIIQYLNTPTPAYAVLLRGEWGVGKSFYWNQFKNSAMPEGKQEITFSVAGLVTLEELERALFLASIKDFGAGLLQETGAVVGRALLRWVKVEPGDIKLKADVRPDHTVICIDDIERFGGEFKVLFGFIVSLLDEARLHVILIADEERARTLPGYDDYKERIISRSFDVTPAVGDIYQYVVNGYLNEKIRAAILDTQAYALSLFEQKCLRNLRTVRAILDEMNAILSGVRWPQGATACLTKLFSAVTFHAMAASRNPASTALVSRAFLQADLSMVMALRSGQRGKGKLEAGEAEAPGTHSLIQSLGFETDTYDWPLSPSFAAYVQGQSYDPNNLAIEFEIFKSSQEQEQDQPLLAQFRGYRSMNEQQFREAVGKLSDMTRCHQFQSLQEIWTAYEIWHHLSQQKLIKQTCSEARDVFLEVINGYDPARDIKASLEIWTEPRDSNQVAVVEALRALEARIGAETQKVVNTQLRRSIFEGVGEIPREVHLTPFVGENAEDIFAQLVTAGRPAIYRVAQFFSRRFSISNIVEYTAKEAPFASALAAVIDSKAQQGDALTLDQAALRELAGVLRQFASLVERTQPSTNKSQDGTRGESSS